MSGKTLTRADLAEAVFQKVGLPRNESAEIVELVLREIVASASDATPRRARKCQLRRGVFSCSVRATS
jgi:nucleoid DNA-binding protein